MRENEEWPTVTFILITINLAVFLFGYKSIEIIGEEFGLIPATLFLKPYTLITYMFVHADIIHFGGNMLMLAVLGLAIENRIGSLNFLLLYLISGFITVPFAFVIQYLTNTFGILIGASGAIYGLMFIGGTIAGWEEIPVILVPVLNILALPFIIFTLKNIKVPLFLSIMFYLLLNFLLFVFNFPESIPEFAHFGGLFGGMMGFFLILPKKLQLKK
jgi:hypothetical protein